MAEKASIAPGQGSSATPKSQIIDNDQSMKSNDQSDESQNQTGTFTLLLFAAASTYANSDNMTLPAPMTLKQLFETLEERYPGMKRKVLRSAAVTVNLEYVEFEVDGEGNILSVEGIGDGDGEGGEDGLVIRKGDEVGIIPPVSSG